STPGVRDTFCLVVCDEGGICDTTITIIEVPLPPDTVYYTVPPDSMITSCVDLSEIPGPIASVNSCEDPTLGSIGSIDQVTGCVEYTAPSTPGVRDTFCLVVCDEDGICDTTITIIEVPLPPDTVYYTVPADSMITSCVDLSEIPGPIASVNSCEDPSLGSIGSIDQVTGCVEYTAPSTPGVRDTFCLVVCDEGGICDTTITIIEVPLPPDTVYYTVPADSMITSCVDLTMIPGAISSVNSCEDPSLGSIGSIDQVTGCVEYTAPSTPGVRDTFCLVVCDEGGICDTTITIIEVPLPPDTVYYTVPADSMITSCVDLNEIPGSIASVNSCEDPSLGSIGIIDQGTGCVEYTAPSTPGVRDTFCLVVCDEGGICDTTITIIEVPLPPDTVYYTVPADSMVTSCVDLSEIPGPIASVNSCEDPSLGSIGSIDQVTGCVEYTAPSPPGVRDTFCLVVCDEGGICDTTITIIEVPLPPDTVYYTVQPDSMVTSCVDLSEIPGPIASVNSCEDPSLGSIGSIDQVTGCVEYTAPSTPGVRDTFCLVVCDEGGICDTTITIIEVPLPPDTVYYTVPADSMITSCVDLSEIPGPIASVNSCEDPSLGSIGSIDQVTGCVEYTAPSTPGVRDTFCLVVCDEGGICDTTITIIEVPLPPDTVYYTVQPDSMVTSCVDLSEIPGPIASVNSCEDPTLGSIGSIDQVTGCVEYTAPSTPGVRDTFCLVVCDEDGICDTTITIIEVPLPPDTVYYTVPADSMITSCVDLSEIPGPIASVNSCEDPSLGSIGSIDQVTGCVEYTAPSTPGVRDTFCLVVCDEGGICDTTITIIEVPLPPDTVYYTVPADSMITSCVDLTMIPGAISSVSSCGDPSLGSIGSIDQVTGCVEYTAPSTLGVRDTFCLVVCDEDGICDTTVTIIEVPVPGVVMTKDILIGARPTGTVNEYTTTYVIRVEDTTGHRAYYDLSDTIKYGLGANFISAEVSY
uniref:hypothetical protein n=1 Tax=Membranihabitans marinus TaxID=1227546 RepID=UPI001F23B184